MLNNKDKGPVIICPDCIDSVDIACFTCHNFGFVAENPYVGDLLFEAAMEDSSYKRQDLLWKFNLNTLENAINYTLEKLEKDLIQEDGEKDEEVESFLNRFKLWYPSFLMDAKLINHMREEKPEKPSRGIKLVIKKDNENYLFDSDNYKWRLPNRFRYVKVSPRGEK